MCIIAFYALISFLMCKTQRTLFIILLKGKRRSDHGSTARMTGMMMFGSLKNLSAR